MLPTFTAIAVCDNARTLNAWLRFFSLFLGICLGLSGCGGGSGGGNIDGAAGRFNRPSVVVVDSAGTVYVGDSDNHTIRKNMPVGAMDGGLIFKITPDGIGTPLDGPGGPCNSLGSFQATGIAIDAISNLYVAHMPRNAIVKITASCVSTTLAGSPTEAAGSAGRGG